MSTRALRMRLLLAAIATLIPARANLNAQDQPPVHILSICAKALPGKAAEYERLWTGTFSKVAQVLVDEKQFAALSLNRIVAPPGEATRCAVAVVGVPKNLALLKAEGFKKADVSMKAEEFVAARAAARRLV